MLLREYIREMLQQEWHTDLDRVMFDDGELEVEDLENPARSDVDLDDPYSSSNQGLKTSRAMQHSTHLGSGPQSGRSPGSTRQATSSGR